MHTVFPAVQTPSPIPGTNTSKEEEKSRGGLTLSSEALNAVALMAGFDVPPHVPGVQRLCYPGLFFFLDHNHEGRMQWCFLRALRSSPVVFL